MMHRLPPPIAIPIMCGPHIKVSCMPILLPSRAWGTDNPQGRYVRRLTPPLFMATLAIRVHPNNNIQEGGGVLLSGSRQEAGPGLPGHPPHGMRSSMVIGLVSCVWKLTEQRTITLATPYILTSNATLDTAMRDTEVPDLIKVANSIVGAGPAASSLEVIGNSNSNNNNDAWDTNSSGSRSSISRNLGSNGIIYLSTMIMEGTKYYLLLLLCYEIMIMAQQIIVEF